MPGAYGTGTIDRYRRFLGCSPHLSDHVRIPRSSTRGRGYACLIRRVTGNPTAYAFQGRIFRPGTLVLESELRPSDEWPRTPLVLEHAGPDFTRPLARLSSGWGGRRRSQIHVLWRYEPGSGEEWRELARVSSVDNEWVEHFGLIARAELAQSRGVSPVEIAARVSRRWIDALENELRVLDQEELALALGFVYEEVSARLVGLESLE